MRVQDEDCPIRTRGGVYKDLIQLKPVKVYYQEAMTGLTNAYNWKQNTTRRPRKLNNHCYC